MSSPPVAGNPSIPTRWLNGSASVMWIGDSISAALEPYLFQFLRVTPAGFLVRGSNFGSLGSSTWATLDVGGLGTAGLLTEANYTPISSKEAVFNGTTVPTTGLPAAINSRIISNSGEQLLIATRTGMIFGGGDWLAGQANLSMRCVLYRNANSSSGMVRNYARGSSGAVKGVGPYLTLASSTPAYLADDVPLTPPAAGEDLYLETQSFEGATPTAGSNFVLLATLIRTAVNGFTFLPASVGGWDITRWTDSSVISDSALSGMLPLLGITDFVIAMGQNNPAGQTSTQFTASLLQLVSRLRTAAPSASITFLPMYDTNNPATSSGPHLAGFCDAHYAAQQQTSNSCFLNLYSAAGPFTTLNTDGYLSDGVHPTASGCAYVIQTLQGLLDQLAAQYSLAAIGRYAAQADVEDVFGMTNIAQWSSQDTGATVSNVARVQRALNYADATINDYFRGGPYAVPLNTNTSANTVRRWAAVLAGTWLYRSRASTAGAAASASLALPAGASFSAAVNTSTDPYSSLVSDIYSEMASCKAGVIVLDCDPAMLGVTGPSISSERFV